MNDNVVALPGVTPKVIGPVANPDVVRGIEVALDKARRGEIKFVAIAWVDAIDIAHTLYEPDDAAGSLLTSALGAVSYMDKRLGEACMDGATHYDAPRPGNDEA